MRIVFSVEYLVDQYFLGLVTLDYEAVSWDHRWGRDGRGSNTIEWVYKYEQSALFFDRISVALNISLFC